MYESNEHPVSSPFFQKTALLASAGGQKRRGAIQRGHASGARLSPAYRYAVDFSPEPAVCTRTQPTAAPGCPLARAGLAVTAGLYAFAEAGPAILLLSARHRVYAIRWNRKRAANTRCSFDRPIYSMMLETTPEPTVRPPSRIAKRSPCSIAIGVISLIVIRMLSPGMTISTPSGSSIVPVTSVVRK